MFSDLTSRSQTESDETSPPSALPSPVIGNSPPSPNRLITPTIYPGSLFGAPLPTIPELASSSSLLSAASDRTSVHRSKLPLVPPLSLRKVPMGPASEDTTQAPQTPHSPSAIVPSPTCSFGNLKACLQSPAKDNKGKEDTWQDAMRGGFLTFSSSL